MLYNCYKCRKNKVYTEVGEYHFTADTGVILCPKYSIGVKPCSKI